MTFPGLEKEKFQDFFRFFMTGYTLIIRGIFTKNVEKGPSKCSWPWLFLNQLTYCIYPSLFRQSTFYHSQNFTLRRLYHHSQSRKPSIENNWFRALTIFTQVPNYNLTQALILQKLQLSFLYFIPTTDNEHGQISYFLPEKFVLLRCNLCKQDLIDNEPCEQLFNWCCVSHKRSINLAVVSFCFLKLQLWWYVNKSWPLYQICRDLQSVKLTCT